MGVIIPEKKYLLRLSSLAVIALVAFIIAVIVFFAILPFLFPILLTALGILVAIIVFVIIFLIIYGIMVLITAVYYFFKPMKVEKTGSYRISHAKESGKRQKGKSRKKK